MRDLTAIWKNILDKVIIKNCTDLVSYSYCSVFHVKDLHPISQRVLRRTKVVNIYDNKVGRGQLWEGSSPTLRQAIQDMSWREIIQGRVLIIGDMNAYNIM